MESPEINKIIDLQSAYYLTKEAARILTSKRVAHKGFTLIEILVVLSLIAILAAVFLLQVSPMLDKTDKTADASSLRTLDSATILYKILENNALGGDVFGGFTTDLERLTALFDSGNIDRIPVSSIEGNIFAWIIPKQKWKILHIVLETEINMGTGGHTGYIKDSFSGDAKDIVIPTEIDGTPVTQIWQDVFRDKGLTSVVIEEGLTRINARAFQDNDLTEIVLPNSIARIDYGAFMGNDIKKITIGAGVTTIETKAFGNDNSFKDAYNAGGAGTYILTGGVWVKQ